MGTVELKKRNSIDPIPITLSLDLSRPSINQMDDTHLKKLVGCSSLSSVGHPH
jgi:hypothetical protein